MTPGRTLGLVLLAGAALRFATLDLQSLWFDETVTAQLLQMGLGDMLRAIPGSESSPPLYYVLAWLWAQAAGTGEVGLRAFPALLGTATIPVVWALARRIGGARAGLYAAALVAINPMLVWFSQEARVYSLLALLAAGSALLWLRALEDLDFVLWPSNPPTSARPRAPGSPAFGRRHARLLAWGAVAALALATHYYAIFLVGPQALWLLIRAPGLRARAAALALPAVTALALAPLALAQRSNDSAAFINASGLAHRLAQVPKQFLVGYDAPVEKLLAVASAVALLAAVAGLLRLLAGRAGLGPGARADAVALTAVTAAALVVPALLALAGEDHLVTRNLLSALPLVLALAGTGLAAAAVAARAPAVAAAAAACAFGLVAILGVDVDPAYQRDDWRGAAHALGTPAGERIIVTAPGALEPLRYYLTRLQQISAAPPSTTEVDYVAVALHRGGGRGTPPRPDGNPVPGPGFVLAGRTDAKAFTVLRLRAPAPAPIDPQMLASGLDGRPAVLLLNEPEPSSVQR